METNKPQHTPGPWVVDDSPSGSQRVMARTRQGFALQVADINPDLGLARANATALLMAAAPDLLEALKVLIGRVAYYAPAMERNGDLDEARAAIAKAEGK